MAILPTHKAAIVYLEHCRISVRNDMVTFTRKPDALEKIMLEKHYSLPYGNINALVLGPGTSISQKAAYLLSGESVSVIFTGGGGTPVYLASQSEYRKPEFLQGWIKMWINDDARLQVAKEFQHRRCQLVLESWSEIFENEIKPDHIIEEFRQKMENAKNTFELLGHEGDLTRGLFKILAKNVLDKDFKRTRFLKKDKKNIINISKKNKSNKTNMTANEFLNSGNYLAYGLANSALWILGISHSLSVVHGKTRRGGLVFDVADIIKDASVLPLSFLAELNKLTYGQFRTDCINWFEKNKALKIMLEEIKKVTEKWV